MGSELAEEPKCSEQMTCTSPHLVGMLHCIRGRPIPLTSSSPCAYHCSNPVVTLREIPRK